MYVYIYIHISPLSRSFDHGSHGVVLLLGTISVSGFQDEGWVQGYFARGPASCAPSISFELLSILMINPKHVAPSLRKGCM